MPSLTARPLLSLVIVSLVPLIGWQSCIPEPLQIPFFMIFPLYLPFLLLVLYRQASTQASPRERKVN